jgi:hypothetical protein
MISALSPCISFVVLLLISRASNLSWRESILAAAVIWGLLLTIITEALSAFEALSYSTVLAAWLLSGAALAVLYLWYFMDKGLVPVSVGPVASAPLLLVLPIGFIVSLTGLIAFVAPPNNWDSMTYHLGRVVHWVQNHSVQHYPTNIQRQLFMPPWAEFAVTHFYVLNGGDRLSNGVQWFCMLGSLTGVSLIAKQLGGSKESQLLAALIAACVPMGILQASSTQTDYVLTLWLVCFAHYVIAMNCPHYLRNIDTFGSPLGPPGNTSGLTNIPVAGHGEMSPLFLEFASNLMKNTASELATPFYYLGVRHLTQRIYSTHIRCVRCLTPRMKHDPYLEAKVFFRCPDGSNTFEAGRICSHNIPMLRFC